MKLNFIHKFLGPDPAGGLLGAAASANPLGLALSAAQTGFGALQSLFANGKIKKILARRESYQTPEEYTQILQATQSQAQQGFDPTTLNYLTNQTDRAFSGATDAAVRLGANPNDLSRLFDQKMQQIMQIGAQNHDLNMKNFDRYISAVDTIGQNKIAEFNSEQDILKDKLQAAGLEKQAGIQNVGSGLNSFISLDASRRTSDLYKNGNNDLLTQLAALLNKK